MNTAFSWNENHAGHVSTHHPERPDRLRAIIEHLQSNDVWRRLDHLPPLTATRDDAELVHSHAYIDRLETATAYGSRLDPDTYTTHRSLEAAYASLGSVLAVTEAVLEGRADNGMAASRPPGHHATPDRGMGFCLLSNAAIAARWAQVRFGIERVAIMDFDVHHGNGTQDVFYADPSVLYMSTHQWPLYPGTGAVDERGSGDAVGTTINVPLPSGAGDAALAAAFDRVLAPVVNDYRPQLVLLSAGYDAHWRDPLASMTATVDGFAGLIDRAMEWADASSDGRLVVVLEGGYDEDALAQSAHATIHRLLREPRLVDVERLERLGLLGVREA